MIPAVPGRGEIISACLLAGLPVQLLLWLPTVQISAAPAALFVESASQTGLVFTHVNGATGQYYIPEQMGSGAALFDYDNDGDLDVFLVQGCRFGADKYGKSATAAPTSRLFRNDLEASAEGRRALRFTDVTERAGLDWQGCGMGAAVGDYDNDGHLDLFVTGFGSVALFRNKGNGTFTDVTIAAGVSDSLWSTSAAFVDYDRDGYVDLFVAHYLDFTLAGNRRCDDSVGARDYCSPRMYRPVVDRLFRNLGNGTLTDVTESAGISKAYGAGLGVATGDYNGDGWLDLFVANDATPNQLWINRGDGTFVDEGPFSGTAFNVAGNPEGSMGIASGDYDRDGDEDLFISNLVGETFVLYGNDGRANFVDVRTRTGVAHPTAAFTGFGTDWIDYDQDSWPDLFVANGAVNIIEAQRGQPVPFRMRNLLLRNLAGTRFEDVSQVAGPALATEDVGRGAAFGDIDNDGDVDIVVTNNGGAVRLLINQAPADRHWLNIRLEQRSRNRFAFGAWVGVERKGHPVLWRRVRTDGSYLSASDVRVHVGLGSSAAVDAVRVQWPDGEQGRWTRVTADRVVTLRRGSAGERP